MPSLRCTAGRCSAAILVGCVMACSPPPAPKPTVTLVDDPLPWVDPRIGTGGFGYTHGAAFVGATAPRGLVKVGPDTRGDYGTIRFLHYSGYWANDSVVQGFSHMHLHGTGAPD